MKQCTVLCFVVCTLTIVSESSDSKLALGTPRATSVIDGFCDTFKYRDEFFWTKHLECTKHLL